MAKKVIRYLLEGDGTIPKFVHDGGYFPLNQEFIGISVDSAVRFVPATVHEVTREELEARLTALGSLDVQADADYIFDKVNA